MESCCHVRWVYLYLWAESFHVWDKTWIAVFWIGLSVYNFYRQNFHLLLLGCRSKTAVTRWPTNAVTPLDMLECWRKFLTIDALFWKFHFDKKNRGFFSAENNAQYINALCGLLDNWHYIDNRQVTLLIFAYRPTSGLLLIQMMLFSTYFQIQSFIYLYVSALYTISTLSQIVS